MQKLGTLLALALVVVPAPLGAKQKKQDTTVTNVFDAAPEKVYDAVYRYAQHNGTIKYSDDKRMTLTATIYIPGGKWSYRKDYDCTISVEPHGKDQAEVDVIGTYTTRQTTLSDLRKKNSPAVKVIEGIRAELDQGK